MKREFRRIEVKTLPTDMITNIELKRAETPTFSGYGVRGSRKHYEELRKAKRKAQILKETKNTQRHYKRILSQEGKDIDKTISYLNSISLH